MSEVWPIEEQLRLHWPDKSDEWRAAWLARAHWYIEHGGDMSGAPELPEA